MGCAYREQQPTAIRQLWWACADLCAQHSKVTIQLAIIEPAERDSHHIAFPDDLSWQLEERFQPLPGGMDTAGKLPSVGKCSRHIVIYSLKVGRLPQSCPW